MPTRVTTNATPASGSQDAGTRVSSERPASHPALTFGLSANGARQLAADLRDRAAIAGLWGRGEPLDAEVREQMEATLGHDFAGVRVFADERASTAAGALHAQAYAIGSNIAFARGGYAPSTTHGRWLLAHELAHVVQQGRGGNAVPNDGAERAADAAAVHAAAGRATRVVGAVATGVQCAPAPSTQSAAPTSEASLFDLLSFDEAAEDERANEEEQIHREARAEYDKRRNQRIDAEARRSAESGPNDVGEMLRHIEKEREHDRLLAAPPKVEEMHDDPETAKGIAEYSEILEQTRARHRQQKAVFQRISEKSAAGSAPASVPAVAPAPAAAAPASTPSAVSHEHEAPTSQRAAQFTTVPVNGLETGGPPQLAPRQDYFSTASGRIVPVAAGSYAAFGDVETHENQDSRLFLEGDRKEESEHVIARVLVNRTGHSYDDQYEGATTIVIPYQMARFKTWLDLQQRARVDQYLKAGLPVPADVQRDSGVEGAIKRMLIARQATGAFTIDPQDIERAARAQWNRMTPQQRAGLGGSSAPSDQADATPIEIEALQAQAAMVAAKQRRLTRAQRAALVPPPLPAPTWETHESSFVTQPQREGERDRKLALQEAPKPAVAPKRASDPVAPDREDEPAPAPKRAASASPAGMEDEHLPESDKPKAGGKKQSGATATVKIEGSRVGAAAGYSWNTPEVSMKYATMSGHVSVNGEVMIGAPGQQKPVDEEIYAQISRQLYGQIDVDGYEIVDWGSESNAAPTLDLAKREAGVDVSVGVFAKCRNGRTISGTLHLLQAGRSAATGVMPHVRVLGLSFNQAFPLTVNKAIGGVSVTGTVTLTLGLSVHPNVTEVLKVVAPRLIASLGLDAAGEVAAELTGGAVAIGAIGGYITIKAMLASFEDFDEMKKAAADAKKGVESYVGGFLEAAGGTRFGSDESYLAQGAADGTRYLEAAVKDYMKRPSVRLAHHTEDQVRDALRIGNRKNIEALNKAVRDLATVRIKQSFLQQWRSNKSVASQVFTKIETQENELRALMGLPPRPRQQAAVAPKPIPPEEREALAAKLEALMSDVRMDWSTEGNIFQFMRDRIRSNPGAAADAVPKVEALHEKMRRTIAVAKKLGKQLGQPVDLAAVQPDTAELERIVAQLPKVPRVDEEDNDE